MIRQLLRAIVQHYPIRFGKGYIANMLFNSKNLPDGIIVTTKEGIRVEIHPDWMYQWIYLYREYEPETTLVFKRIIKKEDVCFDIGANFGYYSCLFAKLGSHVHAFEPLHSNYRLNIKTIEMNGFQDKVDSVNVGMGASSGTFTVYTFAGLPIGQASATTLGREDAVPHSCQISTLDDYCKRKQIENIDFMKVDIEGHELECFQGGANLLKGCNAPILHFEVNQQCLKDRGRNANEIVSLLTSYGYTRFYCITKSGLLQKVTQPIANSNADYIAYKAKDDKRMQHLLH